MSRLLKMCSLSLLFQLIKAYLLLLLLCHLYVFHLQMFHWRLHLPRQLLNLAKTPTLWSFGEKPGSLNLTFLFIFIPKLSLVFLCLMYRLQRTVTGMEQCTRNTMLMLNAVRGLWYLDLLMLTSYVLCCCFSISLIHMEHTSAIRHV